MGSAQLTRLFFSTSAASSSERSALYGLPAPRGRRAASLQRAERFSRPYSPTWQTRCLAPASGAFFRASRPHVSDALLRSREQSVFFLSDHCPTWQSTRRRGRGRASLFLSFPDWEIISM
ncbi:hypothetical protein NDU88_001375 [Pleurodeles waltl]|uniref:Secreted protein n=1 Tax=Pleurodeles waltl TaxID=8319 RepID=A0AAV7P6H0_PLEWA|nr:hypothetical protein NDU88_001375 [Pleurodeles waltl]